VAQRGLTPEQHAAYLYLIYKVSSYIRHQRYQEGICGEECWALDDAIHNVPELLARGTWDDSGFRGIYLERYDREWAEQTGFSLLDTLEEGLQHARRGTGPVAGSCSLGQANYERCRSRASRWLQVCSTKRVLDTWRHIGLPRQRRRHR
jgi:hypothetical protein